MTKFHGMKTRTTNLEQYLPETYHKITHTKIAENLNETHTIQIPTCHKYVSLCFDTREILLKFGNTDHLQLPDISITFEPDYYHKICISIEYISIELPDKKVKTFLSTYTTPIGKTYYPGTKHYNKYFTAGTRVYQCIKLNQHTSRQIHHFGRYLGICYDKQPKDNPNNTNTNINQNSDHTPVPISKFTPTTPSNKKNPT